MRHGRFGFFLDEWGAGLRDRRGDGRSENRLDFARMRTP